MYVTSRARLNRFSSYIVAVVINKQYYGLCCLAELRFDFMCVPHRENLKWFGCLHVALNNNRVGRAFLFDDNILYL